MNERPLDRLLDIMRRLRDPKGGCPWDLTQDYASLAPYTLEEACEVVDALESGASGDLRDELGDLLFQIVFLSQLASEDGRFVFDDVARAIGDKLVQRHPHVFGSDAALESSASVLHQWEARKAEERRERGLQGVLSGVPLSLPALVRASKLGKRAARVGFDWPDATGARRKVDEELAELDAELVRDAATRDEAAIDEELGDVLFSVVSWARLLGRDPERVLRAANRKFEQRFAAMEARASARGQSLPDLSPEAWDALWEAAKRAP
ncbi:MAG: nucleoside triphosphate pyrophosphohydrolase [Steroidobacteraceae bacterium]